MTGKINVLDRLPETILTDTNPDTLRHGIPQLHLDND